jgi:type VI secretion system protein ImpL
LQFSNPLPEKANDTAVARGRAFLRQFNGAERIYQYMLAEAEKKSQPVQFNQRFPAMAAFVTDGYQVPGAFTKAGFRFMQEEAFKTRVDQFLQGESWVVGEGGPSPDKPKLVAALRSRYAAEYAEQWRRFLRSASVNRYGGLKEASQKLTTLSGNQSPLLKLLSVASWNTNVSPDIAAIFQPVQSVTPATDTTSLIGAGNKQYMGALIDLQSKVDQVAIATGPQAQSSADQARSSAGAAKSIVLQMATTFTPDAQGRVQDAVQTLLQQPITNVEGLLTHVGADQVNRRVSFFCGGARSVLQKFPFDPNNISNQASIQEIVSLLKPSTGTLWTMYGDALQNVLQRQGSSYQLMPGDVKLSPAFIEMFNRLAAFSDLLFAQSPAEPKLAVTVKPIYASVGDGVTIRLEGTDIRANRNLGQQTQIDWPGTTHDARLSAQITGYDATLGGPFNGLWALFQLFYGADSWQQISATTMRADFVLRSGAQVASPSGNQFKVSVNVSPIAAAQVLHRSYFAGISCPSEPAR